MIVRLFPGSVRGEVGAQPSKSYAHRALVCSAFADGMSKVYISTICDDVQATVDGLTLLGVDIRSFDGFLEVSGDLCSSDAVIDCKESGTTLRFLTGVASTLNSRITLTGRKSLLRRPMEPLLLSLKELGAKCSSRAGFPPVRVHGPIKGGFTCIPGNISSQFTSSLLLAAPKASNAVSIDVYPPLESKPYVEMTIRVQEEFGINIERNEEMLRYLVHPSDYQGTTFSVPGDWSSSAPILLAGALTGRVTVRNLTLDGLQADSKVVEVIKQAGSTPSIGPDYIAVEKAELKPIEVDIRDCPDLFPVLAAFSALIPGRSVLKGVTRQKYKESNRTEVILRVLRKVGVYAEIRGSSFVIEGTGFLRGGVALSSEGDHRIAMALALLALGSSNGLTILDAQAVSKSYPGFWKDLRVLGVDAEVKRECP